MDWTPNIEMIDRWIERLAHASLGGVNRSVAFGFGLRVARSIGGGSLGGGIGGSVDEIGAVRSDVCPEIIEVIVHTILHGTVSACLILTPIGSIANDELSFCVGIVEGRHRFLIPYLCGVMEGPQFLLSILQFNAATGLRVGEAGRCLWERIVGVRHANAGRENLLEFASPMTVADAGLTERNKVSAIREFECA